MITILTALALLAPVIAGQDTKPARNSDRLIPPHTASTNARTAAQMAFDVISYDLSLKVYPATRSISGENTIRVQALAGIDKLVFDLDGKLRVTGAEISGQAVGYQQKDGKIYITPAQPLARGQQLSVRIAYGGAPHVAKRAPWDGGFVWSETPKGEPWIATAVQGSGCDLFWPCIDDVADRPDRMDIRITVPKPLTAASNGILQQVTDHGPSSTYHWRVINPISSYNVALNIGPYVRLQQNYKSVNGDMVPVEFWALPENAEKAEALVNQDLLPMVQFFEQLLGPYPWANEKLGIVETPHLGMEHQTINAYGNGYKKDAYGYDWLLQHELSHEWFGNLMSHKRNADFWLHEGFARYMQAIYAGHTVGAAGYWHYMWRDYGGIMNCNPPVPDQAPHTLPAGQMPGRHDIYNKGAWFLHTLRYAIGEKAFWNSVRALLYGMPQVSNIKAPMQPRQRTTDQFLAIVNQQARRDMTPLFNAILRQAKPPSIQRIDGAFRYVSADGTLLDIPVETSNVGNIITIDPKGKLYRTTRPTRVCGG